MNELLFDREIIISDAGSRESKKWTPRKWMWSQLVDRLGRVSRGTESHAEFMRMSVDEQSTLKDVGGFVGGIVRGRRLASNVETRELVCLDIDSLNHETGKLVRDNVEKLGVAACIYSTRKHCTEKPRLRVVILLSETVTDRDMYSAIARKTAEQLGIEYCDPSTFDLNRLMYWPSASADSEFIYEVFDNPPLEPGDVLALYGPGEAWRDVSLWPVVPGADASKAPTGRKKKDPRERNDITGAWCRVHDIYDVLGDQLADVYLPTDDPERYTYAAGTTSKGAIVMDNGLFLYSFHGTDPAGYDNRSSWELCRIHLYGELDKDYIGDPKHPHRAPSFRAMEEYALKDDKVRAELLAAALKDAQDDFKDEPEEDKPERDWKLDLQFGEHGVLKPSLENFIMIVRNDDGIRGLRYNALTSMVEITRPDAVPWNRGIKLEWNDRTDDAQCRCYIAEKYHIYAKERLGDAIMAVSGESRYDPIIEFIESRPAWDGVARLDTALIDYLGAADTPYTRAVTRKTFVACIARQYEPGKKFDTVLTLIGQQGCGKSTFLRKMGGEWFADTLTMNDLKDKTAAEKIQSVWIMEIAELTGMRKADDNAIKQFTSCQNDLYRGAYARVATNHPRRCVLMATTNEEFGFLRDVTGGRRWWPVDCAPDGGRYGNVFDDMTPDIVDQLWAEALYRYRAGETLTLDEADVRAEALERQRMAMEQDDRTSLVQEFLNRRLPMDWDMMDISDRRAWLSGDFGKSAGTKERTEVSLIEIWCECFGRDKADMNMIGSKEIARMMCEFPEWERPGKDGRNRKYVGPYGRQRVYHKSESIVPYKTADKSPEKGPERDSGTMGQ